MPSSRGRLFDGKTLEEIADFMAGSLPNSGHTHMAKTEFLLRQTGSQEESAKATMEMAQHAKKYTRLMFWSVVILAVSALGTFIIALSELFK